MYRAMAPRPGFLEANWNNVKAVMTAPGQLDRLTREIIKPNSVSVSDSAHRCGLLLASVTRAAPLRAAAGKRHPRRYPPKPAPISAGQGMESAWGSGGREFESRRPDWLRNCPVDSYDRTVFSQCATVTETVTVH
jgi:hypothetical protein